MPCLMSKGLLVLLAAVWVLGVSGSGGGGGPVDGGSLQELHCPPCERIHCTPKRALKLQCKGGITTGICGCCPVCARMAGESCGGKWDYLGKCDQGLVCIYQVPSMEEASGELRGSCKEVLDLPLEGEACRPDCTWDFCRENPSEVCSARTVGLEKRECQGSCQHTTCSSCLVLRQPQCRQTCATSDLSCLRHYGKCVRDELGASQPPACHHDLQSRAEGYFLCHVPHCPTSM
ncbi:cysteine-rich motor neuron 1 protein [Amia ocellicauda]|uniref:cysteine-rich motor neuron 1 protein n=1 Tax=Amia ocellicauda TaxID=2972642 RepID=UPI0034644A22